MEVRFDKTCHKDTFFFPLAVEWVSQPWQYYIPARELIIHFLWWSVRWTFLLGEVR